MKPPSAVALFPDGSSYSGHVLLRRDQTTIWGFHCPITGPLALPKGTVLAFFPPDTSFWVCPEYDVALGYARAEYGLAKLAGKTVPSDRYREITEDIPAPQAVKRGDE